MICARQIGGVDLAHSSAHQLGPTPCSQNSLRRPTFYHPPHPYESRSLVNRKPTTMVSFEGLFGVLGLISSNSKSRHKSRLENEWRLQSPLNASLLRESGLKSTLAGTGSSAFEPDTADSKRPIFSTSGSLAAANSGSGSANLFSSTSSSSASSITSSNSTSAFIKPPGGDQTKKYEFRLNLLGGEKGVPGASPGFDKTSAGNLKLSAESTNANFVGQSGRKLSASNATQDPHQLPGEGEQEAVGDTTGSSASPDSVSQRSKFRKFYCYTVCATLWLQVFRLILGLLVDKSILTLDFFSLGNYKIHFLIPAMCLAIQAAAVSTLFIRNNDETNWLVPFYSSKDYLIRSRSNFKPHIEDYKRRVNISLLLALVPAFVSSESLSAYLVHCIGQSDLALAKHHQATAAAAHANATSANEGASSGRSLMAAAAANGGASLEAAGANRYEQLMLAILLVLDVVWAGYSTYICFVVSFYFNLICSIMKARFHGISRIIEDLAESNTTKTTNQARKITTLYLEHNEACELLDESNDFWQYLIFFTYFTYIPAYCYCLYNLFFVDFEAWPSFITWVIHTHTGFIILLISFSAAGVSTEAHAPYTSLHTLSLIQLPLDVEVNIATFLHRVRGLTIGYSCYDLFAITNASMSNTAAACASYFLIVADFSRSSVFTLAQANGSSSTSATASGTTPISPTPSS